MYFVCLLSFAFTSQIECSDCCVWFQRFTQWCCSCVSNVVAYWCEEKWRRVNCWWMSFVPSSFCLHNSDWVQWLLCLISTIHSMMLHLFLQSCCLLFKKRNERVICWFMSFACLLSFCLHFSDRVQWVLCLASMIHLLMLFLRLQCCYLFMKRERKIVNCWWMSFVCLLYYVFTPQAESSECCVGFQCFAQWCCSCVSNIVPCCCEEKWKRVNCWWMSFVCLLSFFFYIHNLDRVRWVWCLFSVPH